MATKEQAKVYYQKNRIRVLARMKAYNAVHKERRSAYIHKYYLWHLDKLAKKRAYDKKWAQDNYERRLLQQRLRRANDPMYNIKTRVLTYRKHGGYGYILAPSPVPEVKPEKYNNYWFLKQDAINQG